MKTTRPLAAFGVWAFIRVVHKTLRVRHVHPENLTSLKQYIISFWHEHLLFMLHSKFRYPIMVMISRSKDGQISFGVFERYGVESAQGSSNKGGSGALRELIRATRSGRNIVFTPDGPTGPPRIAKNGVIFAAQASGLPIVPIAIAFKHKTRLSSWDRMQVPFPFTRAIYHYGSPIVIPRNGDVEEWRATIERVMNDLADEADREFEKLWQEGTR